MNESRTIWKLRKDVKVTVGKAATVFEKMKII